MQGVWSTLFHNKAKEALRIQKAVLKKQPAAIVRPLEKNHECAKCKQKFSNKGGLARHLQTNPTHDYFKKSTLRPQQCTTATRKTADKGYRMIIPGIASAFKWLPFTLVAQAATVQYNKVTMDSVVISGSGNTATVAGALVITGVTTATGLQINGATTITGSLTASTYPVMPERWIQKQATSIDVPADDSYFNITGLTHTFTALAGRMYDINCDTEAVAITSISHFRVDVSVWDGSTILSSQRSSLVFAVFSPNEKFFSLGSRWTGTLTVGPHTITCKFYLPGNLVVSTWVGDGSTSSNDATGTSASFNNPHGVAISPDGAYALVADYFNNKIRKIVVSTAVVSTLAGGSKGLTDGTGTSASFNYPYGVAISPDGAYALVAGDQNHKIRKIVVSTAVVSTLAGKGSAGNNDGTGTSASFNRPFGVAISPDGAYALVADANNHKIRKIVVSTAVVSTLAGKGSAGSSDATGTSASFYHPRDVAISPDGAYALVADVSNNKMRKIVVSTAVVSTLAGTGNRHYLGSNDATGTSASFKYPFAVAINPDGAYALVGDNGNHMIRKIVVSTAVVSTLAGTGSAGSIDATGTSASFGSQYGVAISPDGAYALVGDGSNNKIRKIVLVGDLKITNSSTLRIVETVNGGTLQ